MNDFELEPLLRHGAGYENRENNKAIIRRRLLERKIAREKREERNKFIYKIVAIKLTIAASLVIILLLKQL